MDPSVHPLVIKLLSLPVLADITSEKAYARRTIWKIVRNLCFGEPSHKYLLTEVGILPYILAPLRGPEALDQDDLVGMHPTLHEARTRENHKTCQLLLLETLTLFTGTRFGRKFLRDSKTYPIMREFDKTVNEDDEEMKEAILRVVEVLISDEGDTKDEYDKEDDTNDSNKKPKHEEPKQEEKPVDKEMEEI